MIGSCDATPASLSRFPAKVSVGEYKVLRFHVRPQQGKGARQFGGPCAFRRHFLAFCGIKEIILSQPATKGLGYFFLATILNPARSILAACYNSEKAA
jgi:hypothetical protein